MRKTWWIIAASVWLAAVGAWAKPAFLSVAVETAPIRETPAVFGKVVATARYGDRVEVLAKQSGWSQVRLPDGLTGWLHESAMVRKKIELSAGAKDVSRTASGEELAMAGKGFNSQVEADFKAKNQNIDFTWIDRMETYGVGPDTIIGFLKEGGLQP